MCCPNCGDSSYKCGCVAPVIFEGVKPKTVGYFKLTQDLRKLVAEIENRAVLHRRRLEFTALQTCNSIIKQAKEILDGGE